MCECVWVCTRAVMSVYYITERGTTCFPKDDRWKDETQRFKNNEGRLRVPFSCLTCKLLRSEFPQISNKFRTADHTLYKASGDTSSNMVGRRGKPARQATKNRKQASAVADGDSAFSPFYAFCTLIVFKK